MYSIEPNCPLLTVLVTLQYGHKHRFGSFFLLSCKNFFTESTVSMLCVSWYNVTLTEAMWPHAMISSLSLFLFLFPSVAQNLIVQSWYLTQQYGHNSCFSSVAFSHSKIFLNHECPYCVWADIMLHWLCPHATLFMSLSFFFLFCRAGNPTAHCSVSLSLHNVDRVVLISLSFQQRSEIIYILISSHFCFLYCTEPNCPLFAVFLSTLWTQASH